MVQHTAWDLKAYMADLGFEMSLQILSDSSAAKAFASRRGSGRQRHVQTRFLWLQERVAAAHVSVQKVKGTLNPADNLTKAASRETQEKHRKMLGLRRVGAHSSQRELRLESVDRESGEQPELGKTGAEGSVGSTRKVGMNMTSESVKSEFGERQTVTRRRPRLMNTISRNSVSQRISSKTGVQQGGLQCR